MLYFSPIVLLKSRAYISNKKKKHGVDQAEVKYGEETPISDHVKQMSLCATICLSLIC